MNENYQKAGKWNIFCGKFTIVCSVLIAVLMGAFIGILLGRGDPQLASFATVLVLIVMAAALLGLLFYPLLMINAGKNMKEGYTEKTSVKILFGFNTYFKFNGVVAAGMTGLVCTLLSFAGELLFLCIPSAVGGFLISVVTLISIVMDFKAYFGKKE